MVCAGFPACAIGALLGATPADEVALQERPARAKGRIRDAGASPARPASVAYAPWRRTVGTAR